MKTPSEEVEEKVLALAVRLRSLLSGENVVLMKRFGDSVRRRPAPAVAGEPRQTHRAIRRAQNILEATNNITQLLTGEVPIRCQDVSIYLSVEERDYLEGHLDLYRMVLDQTSLMVDHDPAFHSSGHCRAGAGPADLQHVDGWWRKHKGALEQTARALALTEDIIHQLASEKYLFVITRHNPLKERGGSHTSDQSEETWSSSTCSSPIKRNDGKILEVTRQMTQLLTGEVALRCQDVAVYFSMDEREYLEAHRELYAMAEDQLLPKAINVEDTSTYAPAMVIPDEVRKSRNEYADLNTVKTEDHVTESPRQMFQCTICLEWFPSHSALVRHSRTHRMHKLTCSMCGNHFFGFKDSAGRKEKSICGKCCMLEDDQDEKEDEEEFSCEECGRQFRYKATFQLHMAVHMGRYACSECGRVFGCESSLKVHLRTHTGERPFACSECGKRFGLMANLQAHQRIHTGEKPFKCSECGKTFRYQSHLKAHERFHTGQTLPCLECGLVFTYNSHLVIHQRIHTGEQPFSCVECGKKFSQSSQLRRHVVTHTGECYRKREYKCQDAKSGFHCSKCNQTFRFSSDFLRHQKSHTSAKDFKCSECGKCYTRNASLLEHQMTHTGEKPYSCPDCGMGFKKLRYMERHRLSHAEKQTKAKKSLVNSP